MLRKMPFNLLTVSLAAAGVLILNAGCATSVSGPDALAKRLSERGPVALSAENPYLAANLLVAREMESSPELKGFVETRGAPSVIEVDRTWGGDLTLYFYYPQDRQQFVLEDLDGMWLIRGPFKLTGATETLVSKVAGGYAGDPKLLESASATDFHETPPEADQPAIAPDEQAVLDRLAAYSQPTPLASPKSNTVPKDTLAAAEIARVVKATASGSAELAPGGDLVHYVSYKGETLSIIARWYTFDRANAGRIARINKLLNPNLLEIGDVIVVPAYLLRNTKRLTEEAVTRLRATVKKQ